MGKFWVEICLISARGLTRTSSLWKLQWFAVGWIDPNNKYCTKVDASGNANPVWKTKFSALVDDSDSRFEDLALSVEVYSRDPVFLKEKLQGTASVGLKEFLDKQKNNSDGLKNVEEVGSFQLRKKNSNKPQGFVDVSIQTSQEMNENSSYEGNDAGIKLRIRDHGVNLPPRAAHSEYHLQENYSTPLPPGPSYHQPRAAPPPSYALTGGSNHQPPHNPLGPSYHQPLTQPPPPYNFGYMPSSSKDNLTPSYINMPPPSGARTGLTPSYINMPPPSGARTGLTPSYINMPPPSGARTGPGAGPGFAMGLGAGALAAGAAIFGDDFISGFDLPTSFTVSTDPPF